MAKKQDKVPDSSGTIGLSGYESLVDTYSLKHAFIDSETSVIDDLKEQLRSAATAAINSAQQGAKRAFLRGSKHGGVMITMPDYDKSSNRPVFSEKKLTSLMKLGGLDDLGIASEDVFEEEREEGGEVIELRGRWVEWFKENYKITDPDVKWEKREPVVTKRVKASARAALEAAAYAGSTVAKFILGEGYKSPTVRVESD